MSITTSPEKLDPKHSTIVNTSIQSRNANLNLVLNRIQNQPPSLNSDLDIVVVPQEKFAPKTNSSKNLKKTFSQSPSISWPVLPSCKQ